MATPFEIFISQLSQTNSTLGSLCAFDKVVANTNKISLKLHCLNHLLGREDLEVAIKEVYEETPNAFGVLNILVAVRDNKLVLDARNNAVGIFSFFDSYEGVCEFINCTGLADIFKSKHITNLVDYVFGIEVGLDSNARKNRGGTIMECEVAAALRRAGVEFREQVSSAEMPRLVGLGEDIKRFDFVVEMPNCTYLIETNYYNSGGSKLNETARAYSDISPKINRCEGYEFVWITDGQGWLSAKNKLEEAFNIIPKVYNLATLKEFIALIKEQ